jgi:hypothetical protein
MAKQKARTIFVYILIRTSNILGSRIRIPIAVKAEIVDVEAHNIPVAMETRIGAVEAHPGVVEAHIGVTDSHHFEEDLDPHKKPNQDPHNKGWIRIHINAAIRTRELHYSMAGRRAKQLRFTLLIISYSSVRNSTFSPR